MELQNTTTTCRNRLNQAVLRTYTKGFVELDYEIPPAACGERVEKLSTLHRKKKKITGTNVSPVYSLTHGSSEHSEQSEDFTLLLPRHGLIRTFSALWTGNSTAQALLILLPQWPVPKHLFKPSKSETKCLQLNAELTFRGFTASRDSMSEFFWRSSFQSFHITGCT